MMVKQKYTVYSLIGFFLIYFISILRESDLGANVLSPIVAFMCSFVIFKSLKNIKEYKLCWTFLFFYPFVWGIADLSWLIYEKIFGIEPINVAFIEILYTLPNIFLAVGLTCYYGYNLKKWNLYQLIVDLIGISSILIVLFLDFIFSKTLLRFTLDFEYINILIYLFCDFYLVSGIIVAFISKEIKRINKRYFYILTGILIIAFLDYYYVYIYLMKLYDANSIIDGLYMLANVIFAIGAYSISKNCNLNKNYIPADKEILPENIRKPQNLIFPFIIFYLLYAVNFMGLKMLLMCIAVTAIYLFLTSQIQEGIRDKILLKKELESKQHLEKVVEERTKELKELNLYLEEISNKDALTGCKRQT